MNIETTVIILKGEDKTEEVEQYFLNSDKKYTVYFKNNSKEYTYTLKNAQVYENPQRRHLQTDEVVFYNAGALFDVDFILDFGEAMRIFFKDAPPKVYPAVDVRIKKKESVDSDSVQTMQYWKQISRYAPKMEDNQENFIAKQFSNLVYVHPESALSNYINASKPHTDHALPEQFIYPFSYNISQKEALKRSLESKISIIEGPPGTGKTQTILNILANLIKMKKTVAVVSSNNAAVQNVKAKFQHKGYHFMVADLGRTEKRKAFFLNPPVAAIDDWQSAGSLDEMIDKIKLLDVQIEQLLEYDRKLAQCRQLLAAYELEQKHFEHFYQDQNIDDLDSFMFYKKTSERAIEFMKDSFLAAEKEKGNSVLYKFKLFVKYGFYKFKELEANELGILMNMQKQFYISKIEELSNQIKKLEQKLSEQSYTDLMEEHQKCCAVWFESEMYKKYSTASFPEFTSKEYQKSEYFDSFIEKYPVMLSTTHALRSCIPAEFLFDYCIVDEASQVDLLTGVLALSCCKQAIIVGDMKQLPHIAEPTTVDKITKEELYPVHESFDYIKHNLLSSLSSMYGEDVPKTLLREHYRCHPRIIEFCNRKYYKGELIIFTKSDSSDSSLIFWKTAPGNHMRSLHRTKDKGKYNQRELELIEREILAMHAGKQSSNEDIGFVTPYRLQVTRAANHFGNIENDTIHKYQGREKKIMIMSTVLDKTKYGNMGMKFVNDPQKINVAVSRAQEQFILVSDREAFNRYGNEIGDLIRYMEYTTLDSHVVESKIVSIFDLLYTEYSNKLNRFRKKSLFYTSSRFKSENLMHTLLDQILKDEVYSDLKIGNQIFLRNLFTDLEELNEEERKYIKDRASVDFVIYHNMDNRPLLAIEIDGIEYHENVSEKSVQKLRDQKKDSIFIKMNLPLFRFPTNTSGEEDRIRNAINEAIEYTI